MYIIFFQKYLHFFVVWEFFAISILDYCICIKENWDKGQGNWETITPGLNV
jgi:hypothetical protein